MFAQSTTLATGRLRPVPATSPDPKSDLQFLFKAYDAACLDFDADAVASFYDLPCLISLPDGNGSFTARGEVRAMMARRFAAYRQQGLVSASMTALTLEALSGDFAQARIVWSLSNTRGTEMASFASAYTLRRADGRWRIAHAVTLDEAAKLATFRRQAPMLSLTGR